MKSCLLAALLASGCLPIYADSVNGLDDNFSFVGPSASVPGEPLDLYVAHAEAALAVCLIARDSPCGTVAGGDQTPIAEVLSLGCDDGACTVAGSDLDPNGVLRVTVTGAAGARGELRVRARLGDGREMADRWPVAFLAPTRLAAYCAAGAGAGDATAACAGRYAVFPGATVDWRLRAEAGGGDALAPLHTQAFTATVSGDAIAVDDAPSEPWQRTDDAAFPYWTMRLHAVKPGVAVVHLAAGGATRDLPIRVAAADEVVDAALAGARRSDEQPWAEAGDDPILGAATHLTFDDYYGYAIVLTLADGTRALGGAGYTRTDGKAIYEFSDENVATADPAARLAANRFQVHAAHVGDAAILLDLGDLHRRWPISVSR